jgi:hypothetical protein
MREAPSIFRLFVPFAVALPLAVKLRAASPQQKSDSPRPEENDNSFYNPNNVHRLSIIPLKESSQ